MQFLYVLIICILRPLSLDKASYLQAIADYLLSSLDLAYI